MNCCTRFSSSCPVSQAQLFTTLFPDLRTFLIEESHYIHAGFFSSFWKYIYDYVNSIYTDEDDLFWWNN